MRSSSGSLTPPTTSVCDGSAQTSEHHEPGRDEHSEGAEGDGPGQTEDVDHERPDQGTEDRGEATHGRVEPVHLAQVLGRADVGHDHAIRDRKSTRLNSSHVKISY